MEMSSTDENLYFACLEDRPQAFLLQNSTDDICQDAPSLHIEPIFTEILFSDNLISESTDLEQTFNDNNEVSSVGDICPETNGKEQSIHSENFYPVEVPEKSFATTDLFTPTDLLLQLNLQCENTSEPQNIEDKSNEKTLFLRENLTIENENNDAETNVSSELRDLNENTNSELTLENNETCGQIIQILNADGSVINIDKSLLSPSVLLGENESNLERPKLEDFYEIVPAFKCKNCRYLCESNEEMLQHLKDVHLQINEKINKIIPEVDNNDISNLSTSNGNCLQNIINGEMKMVSILNNKINNCSQPTKKTLFLCSQCNVGYTKKDALKTHILTTHPKLKEIPKKEESGFVDVKMNDEDSKIRDDKFKLLSANLIKKQQKASKKIKCSVKGCELRFAREDTRKRHEACHVDGKKKQFACNECGERFSIWRICSSHLWKCHKIDMDLFTCPMCNNFKASTSFRILSHMAIHNDEKPFLCSACGKTFKTLSQLRNHQVIHKEVSPEWMSQQQCEICQKFFANSKSLKKHVQCVHDKYKPFICNVCGHKTARKAMLELHLRQHTGEKPHKCPMCEYKTGDHNSLRRHMMRHSGDMKYSCPHCDYQSIQSTAYKNHIANKHPGLGGSYFCELCSYHTVNEIAYTSHMIDHKNGLILTSAKDNVKYNSSNGLQAYLLPENIFNQEISNNNARKETEDDETQNCFLSLDNSDETVDTGGITIPENLDL